MIFARGRTRSSSWTYVLIIRVFSRARGLLTLMSHANSSSGSQHFTIGTLATALQTTLSMPPAHVVSNLTSISSTIGTQTAFQDLRFEQLRQSKPLARHLVAIIGVDELVVVDTVGRVAFHTFDRWLAGVEGDDIVDEGLTGGREGKALAWVGSVVFGSGGLANFELLSRCGGHFEGGGGGEVVEGLWWFLGDESWFDRRAGECSCWAMQSREHVWI